MWKCEKKQSVIARLSNGRMALSSAEMGRLWVQQVKGKIRCLGLDTLILAGF